MGYIKLLILFIIIQQYLCKSQLSSMSFQDFEPIFTNDGYRPNVGIIICNCEGQVFWARRTSRDGWQFPQGGIAENESVEQAVYRELEEETGLQQTQVKLIAHTKEWLHYDLPKRFLRRGRNRRRTSFKGQKQVWFLLQLMEDDNAVNLRTMNSPEFDQWKWVDVDFALENIIDFKRRVYSQAISELAPYLLGIEKR